MGFGSRPEKSNPLNKPLRAENVHWLHSITTASFETGYLCIFKLNEPLDHATGNVLPNKRGEARVRNEDLDTRAAQNRSLLSTGQDLSYTSAL